MKIKDFLKKSERLKLSNNMEFVKKEISKIKKKEAGVYIIRYFRNGKPYHFMRLSRTDKDGILCIGKTNNLRRRIRQFYKDIRKKDTKKHYHSEGRTLRIYFLYNKKCKFKPKINNIEVSFQYSKDYDKIERNLIQNYVKKFQDKPPLNISIRR